MSPSPASASSGSSFPAWWATSRRPFRFSDGAASHPGPSAWAGGRARSGRSISTTGRCPTPDPMRPSRHTEAEVLDKASGRWRFLADHLEALPDGSLYVHILRSPLANAHLVSWVTEPAL